MSFSERLAFILTLDADGAVRGMQRVGSTADRELGRAESRIDKLSGSMTRYGAAAVAAAGVGAVGLFKLGSAADSQAASQSALNQVLGESSAAVLAWAEDSVTAVGLSKRAALDATTSFGSIAKAGGLAGEAVSAFAIEQTQLAADLAAFKNVSPEQALQDLQAGYAGSTEVLRKYNIYLDDNTLKQALARETGEKVTGTLTAQQKIIAIHSEILRQSTDMQGQWNREIGSAAAQQAMFKASLEDLAAGIGQGVLPVMTGLLGGLNSVVGAFNDLPSGVQSGVGSLAAFATAGVGTVGAIAVVAGQLLKLRDSFTSVGADGARSLTALGKGAAIGGGVAAIGVAALTYAWQKNAEQAAQHKADLADVTAAYWAQGGALDFLTDQTAKYILEQSRFHDENQIDDLNRMNVSVEDLNRMLSAGADGFAEFAAAAVGSGEVQEVTENLGSLYNATGDYVGAASEAVEINGRWYTGNRQLLDSFVAEQKLIEDTAKAKLQGAMASGKLTDAQEAEIQAQLDGSNSATKNTEALLSWADVLRSAGIYVDDVAGAAAALAQRQSTLAAATRDAADAGREQAAALGAAFAASERAEGLDDAFTGLQGAIDGTGDSATSAARSIDLVAEKEKALERATSDVERAQEAAASATEQREDAVKSLTEAEKKLTEAMEGPSARDRRDADRGRKKDKLDLADANDAVTDARKKLTDAEKKGNEGEIAKANRELQRATIARSEAQDELSDSQTKYNEIAGWTAENDPKVAEAQDAVAEANDRLKKATDEAAKKWSELGEATTAAEEVASAALETFADTGSAVSAIDNVTEAYKRTKKAIQEETEAILEKGLAEAETRAQFDALEARVRAITGLSDAQRGALIGAINSARATSIGFSNNFGGFQAEGSVGTVSRPTTFVAGEAGAEDFAFVPHRKGGLRSLTGGGGSQMPMQPIRVALEVGTRELAAVLIEYSNDTGGLPIRIRNAS